MNNKIYSPILQSAQKAFVYQGDYVINFTYPQLVNRAAIKHMQVRITKQQDSKTIVDTSQFPDGIYYTKNFSADGAITLPFGRAIAQPRAGELYKVQLRFGYCDLFTSLSNFTTWKSTAVQNGDFSEWSTVMVIKCISGSSMRFIGFNRGDVLNTLRPEIKAVTQFETVEEEYVDTYKFTLLDAGKVIAESDWLQHLETDEGIDSYTFNIVLEEEKEYQVKYAIVSNNGYEQSISTIFSVSNNYFTSLQGVIFEIDELDYENGGVKLLAIGDPDLLVGKFIISRADESSNYLVWEDLHCEYAAGVKSFAFTDYTVRDGISYKYALQVQTEHGYRTAPLYANEYAPVTIYLEHSYLVGKDSRQLKLMYNVQVSSFKHTVLASKQDTLGSKYPSILRNGIAYYAEFPIAGLISVKEDDINTFARLDSEIAPNILSYENITTEQRFREQVEEFLNDGEPKLFRSATEGNFLVVLMNISLTPQTTVNRALYDFTATAYEIAPVEFNTLRAFGIINDSSKIDTPPAEVTTVDNQLGNSIEGPHNSFNLTPWLSNQVIRNYTTEAYDVSLKSITYIEFYSGDQDATLTVGGKTIFVPAYKRYYYLEPVDYPTAVITNAPSKLALLNYKFSYARSPSSSISSIVDYGRRRTWGQVNNLSATESSTVIQLEHLILQDMISSTGLVPGGRIVDDMVIISGNFEYKINKFTDIIITGSPNEQIGSFMMNETGYYRLHNVPIAEVRKITLDLSKEFLIDYSCSVDWVQR